LAHRNLLPFQALLAGLAAVAAFTLGRAVALGAEAGDNEPLVAQAEQEPAPAGQAPGPGIAGQASRVASNFLTLLSRASSGALTFAKDVVLACVLWAIGGFLLGGLVGSLLWYFIRRRGGFDAPWRWYRWVRWMWFVPFVALPMLGVCYGGFFLGGGRCVNYYLREVRVLDRAAAQLLCAVVLDEAGYQVRGDETAEDYAKVLGDGEKLQPLVHTDLENSLGNLREAYASGPLRGWAFDQVAPLVLRELADVLPGVDPRMLVVVFVSHPNLDEYLNENPKATPALATLAVHFKNIREQACGLVNSVVYPNVLLGPGAGFGVPLACWGLFCLVVYLCRPRPRVAPAALPDLGSQPETPNPKPETDSSC
jgi:hypothetical protein